MKPMIRITLLPFAIATMLPLIPTPSAAQTPQTPLLNLEDKIALGQVRGADRSHGP